MARRWWLIAAVGAAGGAVALGMLVHPFVGSGLTCDGLGWGCTPERLTDSALVAVIWSQLPRHPTSPGSLSAARDRVERILADGKAVAPRGTPLGDALRDLAPSGPLACRDSYGRDTGAAAYRWERSGATGAPAGAAGPSGAITAAALGGWAERLRARGVEATITDPGGDPISDRRLVVGSPGPAGSGAVRVRSSFYISQLEVTAATGCHES